MIGKENIYKDSHQHAHKEGFVLLIVTIWLFLNLRRRVDASAAYEEWFIYGEISRLVPLSGSMGVQLSSFGRLEGEMF